MDVVVLNEESNMPDREKKIFEWERSDKSKDGYVKDDLVQRMLVSQNLGI
jgi:hypothetical protein